MSDEADASAVDTLEWLVDEAGHHGVTIVRVSDGYLVSAGAKDTIGLHDNLAEAIESAGKRSRRKKPNKSA